MNLTLTQAQQDGLAAACAAYNAGQQEADILTPEAFAAAMFAPQLDAWARLVLNIPGGDFVLRFPPAKMAAIIAACAQHPELATAMGTLRSLPIVHLDSELAVNSLAALQAAGLLTREEVLAINPYQP